MTNVISAEQFDRDGFAITAPLLDTAACDSLESALAERDTHGVTERNHLQLPWCAALAKLIRLHPAMALVLPKSFVAVQCTFFEKSTDRNWLVPVHQDLSIPVKARVEHEALAGWSTKDGSLFVRPPESVLRDLVAVRLHVDRCGAEDGPLRIVPGTHVLGRMDDFAVLAERERAGEVICEIEKGGALVMKPLLLHASSKSSGQNMRRVLHFVYGPPALPYGLEWLRAI